MACLPATPSLPSGGRPAARRWADPRPSLSAAVGLAPAARWRTQVSLIVVLSHDHALLNMMRTTLAELGFETHAEKPHAGTIRTIVTLQPGLVILEVEFGCQDLACSPSVSTSR
jgi:hypothetical protein